MKRLQIEFDNDDLAWIAMDYASLYFKRSKKDLAKEMIQEKVTSMLQDYPDIKMSVEALLKKSGQS